VRTLARLVARMWERRGAQRVTVLERTPAKVARARDRPVERLRVVTYNVHKCVGLDRRCSPRRIAAVLREIDGDLIALQEVVIREGGAAEHDQARFLAAELGLHVEIGANRAHRGGAYGNVMLSRYPLTARGNHDLSVPGRERRGCMRADIELGSDRVLHVFNLHLGTAAWERRRQGKQLVEGGILDGEGVVGPRLVLGDFNDWRSELTPRLLAARLNSLDISNYLRRTRTYPGLLPVTHLDHMFFDEALELENVVLHRTRRTLVASDHLPLAADFQWRAGPVEHSRSAMDAPAYARRPTGAGVNGSATLRHTGSRAADEP
jgi:endonuclease/exonuclease/phosphatase family metal-dependent hydrolase